MLALAQLMVVLDATIVNIALPSAQRGLGFSVADRQWVVTAYALAFGGLLLLGGRLADIAGRRRMFLIGLAGFAVASAAGGAAGNFATLVAARAAQGAFGALLAPAALSLLTVTFTTPKERGRALAVFSAVSGGGAAIGLLLGGLLTQYLSWRYCMYVNVVFAAVAIAGALAVLREPAARTRPRLDAASVITVSAGLFALVYGFSHAETADWTSPVTLAALAAGVVLLAAFAALQAKVTSPLLPLRILADRTRAGAYLAIFTVGISIFGMLLFVTYYLQQNLRFSAIEAGLAFLPMTFALAIAAQLSIRKLLPKAGPRAAITPGLLLAAAGAFLLTRLGVSSDYVNLVLPCHAALRRRPGNGRLRVHRHRHRGDQSGRRRGRLRPGQRRPASRRLHRHLSAQHRGRLRRHQLTPPPTPAPRIWPPSPPCTATRSASPGPPPSCWPPPSPPPCCCAARPRRRCSAAAAATAPQAGPASLARSPETCGSRS